MTSDRQLKASREGSKRRIYETQKKQSTNPQRRRQVLSELQLPLPLLQQYLDSAHLFSDTVPGPKSSLVQYIYSHTRNLLAYKKPSVMQEMYSNKALGTMKPDTIVHPPPQTQAFPGLFPLLQQYFDSAHRPWSACKREK